MMDRFFRFQNNSDALQRRLRVAVLIVQLASFSIQGTATTLNVTHRYRTDLAYRETIQLSLRFLLKR